MDKDISEKVNKILDLMLSGIEGASDIASAELPGLLQEYINYFMIDAIPLSGVVLALIFLPATALFYWLGKTDFKENKDPTFFFLGLISFVVFLFSFAVTVSKGKEMYTIKVAPKAYMIEKFRK